ncbi:contactin-associated protein-like 4 isoform 2-T3 [Synchiropus picturatus]
MDLSSAALAGFTAQVLLVLSTVSGTTAEVCDSALVSNLPPSAFQSSSQLSSSHGPSFAKLNRREGAGGWSPLASDTHQWLEVDLGGRTTITAVATQGRYGSSDWLTSYLLMFSDTGHNWRQYRQEETSGSFPGNTNADSVVHYKLQQPAVARFLRLIPLGWNPNGRIGLRMEMYGCPYRSDVMSLDGSSSLVYVPERRHTSREVVSMKFKTQWNFGTLLFVEGTEGLSLSLELEKGKLLLLLRQGPTSTSEPRRLTSLGSLLDDQHWHLVALEWHDSLLNLTVDKHTERILITAEINGWNTQQVQDPPPLTLKSNLITIVFLQLTVGGQRLHKSRSFAGCLENLLYNDVNLIGLAKRSDTQLSVMGNVTFSCSETVSVAATFPGPQSFLQLPVEAWSGVSVGFQFRTWNDKGLLLTFNLPEGRGVVWLTLRRSKLQLKIQKQEQLLLELSTGSGLSDGQWHSVMLNFEKSHLSISVDEEEVVHTSLKFPVAIQSQFYFGGCPAEGAGGRKSHECTNPSSVYLGCMRLLTVDHQPVDLVAVQQRLLNYSQLQVDMCGIIDRCSPNHCEHGGVCSQTWTSFHCNCSETGYRGATCHSSVHQQSCEAYKHRGNTSGRFHIDVDGSGPIGPQLVYCNMTEGDTWMVIEHNNTELTRVRPSLGGNQHSIHLDYMVEEEQLLAAIGQSEHCEQELSYHCRKSRLLNTPEGSPFSWWFGGPGLGHLQTYWGGAQPGSQQCACGLQGDCVDMQHYCNCDADRMEWNQDSGLLTQKDSLPVRSLLLGDVRRPGSEAAYRVGPLRCHGDKSFWNAAFFHKETSYLHFPTFHAELSADISFHFKTNASSGVFLENLGIKDFIRIELSSQTQVLFSLDVGDGPLEVRVDSSSPLNDDRWHRVQAERNVKEATLQVDDLPPVTQLAPADGHFHLQLNSQLFIGGTASRQKGFRGCIRSLQLNGATLDLEERARITPGVHPGCPGHCSSYGSLCRNQGRCVERDSGFECDCSRSAYVGVFCQTEVSASFTPQTSVSYAFKEPYELMRNSSAAPSSIYSDVTLHGENVSLSFRTSQSPALLLYVSSYYREYLALLVNKHGRLEVRYKLDGSREAQVLSSRAKNVADGQLHSLVLHRRADSASLQVDDGSSETFNLTAGAGLSALKWLLLGRVPDSAHLDPDLARVASLGFSGCLSVVLFNRVSPLKAALLQQDSSAVQVSGPLLRSTCGSAPSTQTSGSETTRQVSDPSGSAASGQPLVNTVRTDSALIGGVIAVVIFLLLSGLAVTARVLYRRKETYRSREAECTAVQREDSQDFHFSDARDASSENPKEFFM